MQPHLTFKAKAEQSRNNHYSGLRVSGNFICSYLFYYAGAKRMISPWSHFRRVTRQVKDAILPCKKDLNGYIVA